MSTFKRKKTSLIAKYMNSYLKQAHTKEVEKIGVSSYKVLLNFNDSAWNINKHQLCIYFKKSPVTFMLKTTSKVEKTLSHVSEVSKSLCLCVIQNQNWAILISFFPLNAAFNT
jgi:hypothetical protein